MEKELIVQVGHTAEIKSICFSNNGKYIASSSVDKTIKLWDVTTGKNIKTFIGHTNGIYSIKFSDDDKHLISCSWDKTIKIWNIYKVKEYRTISCNDCYEVDVLHNNKLIANMKGENIRIWNLDKEEEIISRNIKTSEYICNHKFSPNGKYVAIVENDSNKIIKLVEIDSGAILKTFVGHTNPVISIIFSSDCKYIASLDSNNKLKVWNIIYGKEIGIKRKKINIWSKILGEQWGKILGEKIVSLNDYKVNINEFVFSPDGKNLAIGCRDYIYIWDILACKEINSIRLDGFLYILNYSPDGKYIVCCNYKNLKIIEISTGNIKMNFNKNPNPINSFDISKDLNYLVCGGGSYQGLYNNDYQIKLWNISKNKLNNLVDYDDKICLLKFSPDCKYIACFGLDHALRIELFEVSSGEEMQTFLGHKRYINSLNFSPDGKYLVSGSYSNSIKLWDISTGNEIKEFIGHNSAIYWLDFSPDGKYIVSSGGSHSTKKDISIKLWDVSISEEIRTFIGHKDIINSVSFSHDGKYIASGSCDKTIKLWDVSSGKEIKTFYGHTSYVNSVNISLDGKLLISASGGLIDKTIRLWNIETGNELKTFIGHTDTINKVFFISDNTIVSCSQDGSIKFWDINSGKVLLSLYPIETKDWAVISPDGYFDCTPDASNYMYWKEGDKLFPFSKYEDQYYTPGLLTKTLNNL